MAAGLFIVIPYSIRRTERGKRGAMFRQRGEVEKFLAVAEAGKIVAAADRLAIGQPALTRAIARLESRFGAPLFERIHSGVRPTALGTVAADQARHLLRAFEEADDRIGAALAGRSGRIRATADGLWMAGVVPEAVGRFREKYPGIELRLRCAGRAEGLRLLDAGDCDLHCGGIDDLRHLPNRVRRETLPPVTMGVVANLHHPLQAGVADPEALADWPWVDCIADALPSGGPERDPASPDDFLDRLHARTGAPRRVSPQGGCGRARPDGLGSVSRLAAAGPPGPAARPASFPTAPEVRAAALPDRAGAAPLGGAPGANARPARHPSGNRGAQSRLSLPDGNGVSRSCLPAGWRPEGWRVSR